MTKRKGRKEARASRQETSSDDEDVMHLDDFASPTWSFERERMQRCFAAYRDKQLAFAAAADAESPTPVVADQDELPTPAAADHYKQPTPAAADHDKQPTPAAADHDKQSTPAAAAGKPHAEGEPGRAEGTAHAPAVKAAQTISGVATRKSAHRHCMVLIVKLRALWSRDVPLTRGALQVRNPRHAAASWQRAHRSRTAKRTSR